MCCASLHGARLNPPTLFAVALARNGREALEYLQGDERRKVDLILTDNMMPEVRRPGLRSAVAASIFKRPIFGTPDRGFCDAILGSALCPAA